MALPAPKSTALCVLTALLATIVVACAPARQASSPEVPASAPAAAAGNSSQMGTMDGGGGDTDRPSVKDIRFAITKLIRNKFMSQTLASTLQSYKDQAGKLYVDTPVSVGTDAELLEMLDILNEDIRHRGDSEDSLHRKWKFDLRQTGACQGPEGEREGSAKIGDPLSPICLSLPRIQAMTRKADLENAVAALLMHELSHQHGANEALAKKVERYFSLPAVERMESILALRRAVALTRVHLRQLDEAIAKKPLDHSQVCSVAGVAATSSTLLRDQVASTGISLNDQSESLHDAFSALQTAFIAISASCRAHQKESSLLAGEIEAAHRAYDHGTRVLRRNIGINIVNESNVRCSYDSPELCNGL